MSIKDSKFDLIFQEVLSTFKWLLASARVQDAQRFRSLTFGTWFLKSCRRHCVAESLAQQLIPPRGCLVNKAISFIPAALSQPPDTALGSHTIVHGSKVWCSSG